LLEQMAAAANKTVNQPTRVEEDADAFYLVVDYCMCQFRPRHQAPCCFITVGALSEAIKWLTDKNYAIQEITCMNLNQAECRYKIPKVAE